MNRAVLLLAAALILPCAAQAANPVFMEESARIASPDAHFPLNGAVAVDRHFLIATSTIVEGGLYRSAVFMFVRRSATAWAYSQRLTDVGPVAAEHKHIAVDVFGNTAAVSAAESLQVHEYQNGVWRIVASLAKPNNAFAFGSDVAISSGYILVGGVSESRLVAYVYERTESGQWLLTMRLDGGPTGNPTVAIGPHVDIHLNNDGLRAVVGSPGVAGSGPIQTTEELGSAYLFQRGADGRWSALGEIFGPNATRTGAGQVALADILALSGGEPGSAVVWEDLTERGPGWWPWGFFNSPDWLMNGTALSLDASGDRFVLTEAHDEDRGAKAGSLTLYDQQFHRDDFFSPHHDPYIMKVKMLASNARSGLELGRSVSFRGDTIAASSANGVYVFELTRAPTPRLRIEDDFEDGDAQGWEASSTSWTVLAHAGFNVYRQTSTTGASVAILGGMDWTNQSIDVDVRPLAFQGADRWAGVVARYVDDGNHYGVRLRSTNRIEIVRRLNGASKVLGSAPFSVPLNVNHRVRFEAVGTWLRLYVGGNRVLQARDSALKHGAVGMRTFWARAQFDNVVVSDNPAVVVQYDNFQDGVLDHWFTPEWVEPISQITSTGSNRVLAHSMLEGEIYTLSGGPHNPGYGELHDQMIECRIRPVTVGTGGAFGLVARFINTGTFVSVRASGDGQLALIARTPLGGESVLDAAPAILAVNQWHVLRIEATDLHLRVYLNGRFVLQGLNPAPEEMGGRYGVVSKNALVHFDDFLAQLP
jgi:hypothetical protein